MEAGASAWMVPVAQTSLQDRLLGGLNRCNAPLFPHGQQVNQELALIPHANISHVVRQLVEPEHVWELALRMFVSEKTFWHWILTGK